jgi:hypothetical protein
VVAGRLAVNSQALPFEKLITLVLTVRLSRDPLAAGLSATGSQHGAVD